MNSETTNDIKTYSKIAQKSIVTGLKQTETHYIGSFKKYINAKDADDKNEKVS